MRLGLDTGGTYSDAVLMEGDRVVASAKALTTRHDLSVGLGHAVDAVLAKAAVAPPRIAFVALSTTLATNAIVEGQGGRAALVTIGLNARDLDRADFGAARAGLVHIALPGGHDSHGREAAPLDLGPLERALSDGTLANVKAVAVAGLFAVRNRDHEARVAARLLEAGLPSTASHELSPALGGPRRALTTWLNARLLPLVARLLAACDAMLAARGIAASPMIVRGDGSLMTSDFARRFPVETILSGPAASLVGAAHLTGLADASVCDIGGTTSDVGRIVAGRPVTSDEGATVGPHRTMVRAVAMRTHGLGGDSEVHAPTDLDGTWTLGPRRAVPLSLAAMEHDAVATALERAVRADRPTRDDLRFAWVSGLAADGLAPDETKLMARLSAVPTSLADLTGTARERGTLLRLVSKGVARLAAFTPSDAMHALGEHDAWDTGAAQCAADTLARTRDRAGRPLAASGRELSRAVVDALHRRLGLHLLEHAFDADGRDPEWAHHPIVADALARDGGEARIAISLARPVVALGASAHAHVPPAAARVGGGAVVPDHAGVANAVGAVVGVVVQEATVTVLAPSPDRFTIENETFAVEREALVRAEALARERALALAHEAGAPDPQLSVETELRAPVIDGNRTFLEARITARATGRPAASA